MYLRFDKKTRQIIRFYLNDDKVLSDIPKDELAEVSDSLIDDVNTNGYNMYLKDGTLGKGDFLPEEIQIELANEQKKLTRNEKIDAIEVDFYGVIYQGDLKSQDAMIRTISALQDGETVNWLAKDNSIHNLSKADLQMILTQAVKQMNLIWIQ